MVLFPSDVKYRLHDGLWSAEVNVENITMFNKTAFEKSPSAAIFLLLCLFYDCNEVKLHFVACHRDC